MCRDLRKPGQCVNINVVFAFLVCDVKLVRPNPTIWICAIGLSFFLGRVIIIK